MASAKTAKARVRGPFGTAADWETSTRVLLAGEKVYARISNGDVRSKTGDGTKTFHELPYDDEALYESLGGKAASSLSNVSNTDFAAKAAAAGLAGSRAVSVTLTASGWNNKRQTVNIDGIDAETNGIAIVAPNASESAKSAAEAAGLKADMASQTTEALTIICTRDVPTVDIPITVVLFP